MRQEFREKFNRQPTDSEIAQVLENSLKEWQEIKLVQLSKNNPPVTYDL